MRILLFGSIEDYTCVLNCQDLVCDLQYRRIKCCHAPDFDSFLDQLRGDSYDIIVVSAGGAEGMEGVIAAQKLVPNGDIVWLSDDPGFGIQAHRLGCTYFGVKPITEELIAKAYRAYHQV